MTEDGLRSTQDTAVAGVAGYFADAAAEASWKILAAFPGGRGYSVISVNFTGFKIFTGTTLKKCLPKCPGGRRQVSLQQVERVQV